MSLPPPKPQSSTLISAACPSCGGPLQLARNEKSVKCIYCGSSVIIEDAVRNNDGAEGIDRLLNLARNSEEAENSEDAYNYYTRVIEIDPANLTAWLGKGTTALQQSSLNNLRLDETIFCYKQLLESAAYSDNLHDPQMDLRFSASATIVSCIPQLFSKSCSIYSPLDQGIYNTREFVSHTLTYVLALELAYQLAPIMIIGLKIKSALEDIHAYVLKTYGLAPIFKENSQYIRIQTYFRKLEI